MANDNRKWWAAAVWFFGLLGLVAVLVTDKKSDKELKFYGVQATLLGVVLVVLSIIVLPITAILSIIPVVGGVFVILAGLIALALIPVYFLVWLYGLWKAYSLEHFALPLIGKWSENLAAKL